MPAHRKVLISCLTALIAGCAARGADEPDQIRIDKSSLHIDWTDTRQVSVIGTARASIAPDLAEMSLGVTTDRPEAAAAVEANNKAMAGVIEAMKRGGVAAKDIQTSRLSIGPRYDYDKGRKPIGYEVTNTVAITTHDLDKVGPLLDAATKAGADTVYGISFRVDDREAVLVDLRARALDAARAKAALYAGKAGLVLGLPISITESDYSSAPPAQGPTGMPIPQAPALASPAPPMPINAGEQEVSLSISVAYELKPAR